MVKANDRQEGGTHYQSGIQHWDYAWSHSFDVFQYIITKWVERHKKKGGLADLRKARHALDKYIEVLETQEARLQGIKAGVPQQPEAPGVMIAKIKLRTEPTLGAEPGPGYVNQD